MIQHRIGTAIHHLQIVNLWPSKLTKYELELSLNFRLRKEYDLGRVGVPSVGESPMAHGSWGCEVYLFIAHDLIKMSRLSPALCNSTKHMYALSFLSK